MRTLPLAIALALVGGCGVIDEARARVVALWADDPEPVSAAAEPAAAPVAAPVDAVEAEPVEAASTGSAIAVSTGPLPAGAGTSGGAEPASDDAVSTGPLPMSLAHPPTTSETDATGGPDPTGDGPTGSTGPSDGDATTGAAPDAADPVPGESPPPVVVGPSCLEGEWLADDLHTYFRRDVERQSHGRPAKHRGESGRFRLRFEPGVLHGEASHRRVVLTTRLASVDIRYTVDLHGAFEAVTRVEAPDTLVVEAPRSTTLRAREVVRFSASKSETRTLTMPIEGRWQATCAPGSLELRPLEAGKPGPAMRFVRGSP